ncbi:hypothetical protein [Streptomyces tanashiensis]
MGDITTDAQASVTELQQQAADDYASPQATRERETHRDDVNGPSWDRGAA